MSGITHGKPGDAFCYADLCSCREMHKLWPFGIKGTDNIFDEFKPRIGRMVRGTFVPRLHDYARSYCKPLEKTL